MSPGMTGRVEQGWTSRSREARLLAFVRLNVVLQESSLHQFVVWGNFSFWLSSVQRVEFDAAESTQQATWIFAK